MDRDAVARGVRRAQVEEALAFEREREVALQEQLAALVFEAEGPRIDAAAFASLEPDDARRVKDALGELEGDPEPAEDDDPFAGDLYVSFEDDEQASDEDEVARLEHELEESRRTQAALERFVAALEQPTVAEAT